MKISTAFMALAEMFGEIHGRPLPKRLLTHEVGGWRATINPTRDAIPVADDEPGLLPFHVVVYHQGSPVGIIGMDGGTLVASGDDPDLEQQIIDWARGQRAQVQGAEVPA